MKTSETTGELGTALAKAQSEIVAAAKDAKNPHLKNKYADLASVWTACRKPLTANGLGVVQGVSTELANGAWMLRCTTRLQHASGEWIEDVLTLPALTQRGITMAQSIGIAATYARRYGLSALVGIAQEGTDGGPPEVAQIDTEKVYNDGAQAGREWAVKEYLAKGGAGFSGPAFAAALKKAKLPSSMSLEHVKLWRIWRGLSKPSRMKEEHVTALVGYLGTDEGGKSWAAFEAACGPLKKRKAKAAKKKEEEPAPAGNPSWSRDEAEAFERRLKELDFTAAEVSGYLLAHGRPHPSTQDDEWRAEVLAWLEDEGATAVFDWIDAQKEAE